MKFNRRSLPFSLILALAGSVSGCAWYTQRFAPPAPPCVWPDDITQAELVTRLNENTDQIRSWRTTKATIRTSGRGIMNPPPVGAMIAVESPRNFRLIASSPLGNEADLGSNSEHFWFWNKHNEEKGVFQARHDVEPDRMRRFPMPFQPDWIMEALGVVRIDPDKPMTMQPGPAPNTVCLVADCLSPQGAKVRKWTAVDLRHGVIREHALFDSRGQLIARAVLKNHVRDKNSNIVLPHTIDLEWPQASLRMTINLSNIEINPDQISPQTWAVPNIRDNPVIDMTQ